MLEKSPGAHGSHESVFAPVTADHVPAVQGVHDPAPTLADQVPGGQGVHAAWPGREKVPGGHSGAETVPATQKLPLGQGAPLHLLAPTESRLLTNPAPHNSQEVCPLDAAIVPAGHGCGANHEEESQKNPGGQIKRAPTNP